MKIGTLVTLTLLLLCGFAGAQNTFCSSGSNCAYTGNNTHSGTETFTNFQNHTINQALMTGSDWGARVSAAWQMMVNAGWTNGTVDGRTHGVAQTVSANPFTNFPYTPGTSAAFTGRILFDSLITTDVPVVIPGNGSMDGNSPHAGFCAALTGGIIRPSNAFPFHTGAAVVEYGTATWAGVVGGTPPQGVQFTNAGICGIPPNGTFDNTRVCLRNQFAQEGSGGHDLHIDGCEIGLMAAKGGTVSGSLDSVGFYNIHVNTQGCDNVNCRAIKSGDAGVSMVHNGGFRNISANTNGASVQPDICIDMNGITLSVDTWHCEGFKRGVVLGNDTYAKNIRVANGECISLGGGFNGTNCVEIMGTPNVGGNTRGFTVQNITTNGTWTNLLMDNTITTGSTTIPATEPVLGMYYHDGKVIFSTSRSLPSILPGTAHQIAGCQINTAQTGVVMDASDKVLYTCAIPSGYLLALDHVRCSVGYHRTSPSSAGMVYKWKFATTNTSGAGVLSYASTTLVNPNGWSEFKGFVQSGGTNEQINASPLFIGANVAAGALVSVGGGSVPLSNQINITFTANGSATSPETDVLDFAECEVIP